MLAIQLLMLGTGELLLIGAAVLLLFGGKKIPELMRSLGQGVRNFKEGMNDVTEPSKEGPAVGNPDEKDEPEAERKDTDRPTDGKQA